MRGRLVTEWLGVTALRQLAFAWLLWSERERYEAASSFIVVLAVLPMGLWAALWAASGLLLVAAVVTRRIPVAIVATVAAACLAGYWAMATVFAAIQLQAASKILVVMFGTFTLMDLLLLRATVSRSES